LNERACVLFSTLNAIYAVLAVTRYGAASIKIECVGSCFAFQREQLSIKITSALKMLLIISTRIFLLSSS
jgi:hypothetical protein